MCEMPLGVQENFGRCFHHILDFCKKQVYLLRHRSWRSVVSEKKEAETLLWSQMPLARCLWLVASGCHVGHPTTPFLQRKFPASGISVLVV